MYLAVVMAAFCLMVGLGTVYAEDVVILAEDAFVPFSHENGEGLSNQIVQEAFKAAGVNATIKVYPFTRLMQMVDTGKAVGGFNAVPTPETAGDYLFGKYPIYVSHMYFYYHKDDPIEINNEGDIITKLVKPKVTVGEVMGYIYPSAYVALKESKDPAKHLMVDSVKSDDVLIKKIALKRNRIALMTGEVADYHLDNMGLTDKFGRGQYRWDAPLYIAFSKQHPDAVLKRRYTRGHPTDTAHARTYL